ncbi:hypothetical protein BEL04_04955 [Mucilaginibacter sp. PPCGB 2223]|uniref:hypothetical protein n=1 Tax=Mucilaginibacter sp. PPCGB 2223 TaxID=1886027 RepID=UPI0008260E4A|nr:hypothetical protein [Mucilaginibacter sp. PPCGB 2223]OCX53646.1 hypothetical protein BEL04_04955 [Mucilaginibacter sp. PPCGB 2223]
MAKEKECRGIDQDILDAYDRLIAGMPDIERKGAAVPYTSLNGHMTSYMNKTGSLALRLPATMIDDFLRTYNTTLCAAYGVVQKEYAVVPADLLKNTTELKPYFEQSIAYVRSLKPKNAKR